MAMKKTMGWGLAALTIIGGGAASLLRAAADAQTSEDFKSIDIQGVPHPAIRGDKPEDVPGLNAKEPILQYLVQNMDLSSPGDKLLANPPLLLPPRVASDFVAAPWHRLLVAPPVMDLGASEPLASEIAQWNLTVTDDRGAVFRTIKGRGDLPAHVAWDGLGDSGEPLRVGHAYSCALLALDKAGIPSSLSSKTVRLVGYIDQRQKITISLDNAALFAGSASLSDEGQSAMREVRDRLRDYDRKSIQVEVHGRDAELARQQAEAIRDQLAQALRLEREAIVARGLPADDYLRTEIRAR
jgi:hypothetical protein